MTLINEMKNLSSLKIERNCGNSLRVISGPQLFKNNNELCVTTALRAQTVGAVHCYIQGHNFDKSCIENNQ